MVINSITPKVTPQIRPADGGNEPPKGPENEPEDAFKATSPEKHKVGYQVAYGVGTLANLAIQGGTKAGQAAFLGNTLFGTPSFGLASGLALAGGTFDLASGARETMKSAVDRNITGTVKGSLKALQGVATYASVLSSTFGAPGVVSQAAGYVALGAFAGRIGVGVASSIANRFKGEETEESGEADQGPQPPEPPAGGDNGGDGAQGLGTLAGSGGAFNAPLGTLAAVKTPMGDDGGSDDVSGDSRAYEKLFAATSSLNKFAGQMGGLGAFWNNISAMRGNTPGGVWGPLGVVGSTYSIYNGMNAVASGTSNRHADTVVTGTLHTVQGVASLGSSLGVGGRISGFVAAGAAVGRLGYTIYSQAKQFAGDEEEGKESMVDRIKSNIGDAFGIKNQE